MNKYIEAAMQGVGIAVEDLKKFTRENTDFEVSIDADGYPIRFVFSPSEDALQECLFEADENGVIGEMIVTYSSTGTGVDLGGSRIIKKEGLKKLLSKCAGVGEAYLHGYKASRAEG